MGNIVGADTERLVLYGMPKISFNLESTELDEYKQKLLANCATVSLSVTEIGTETNTLVCDKTTTEQFALKSVEELLRNERGEFWVMGNIVGAALKGWYYMGCQKCLKKVVKDGARFYCEKCSNNEITVRARYKLNLRVIDGHSSTLFLLWDRDFFSPIGKIAYQLLKTQHKVEVSQIHEFPKKHLPKKMVQDPDEFFHTTEKKVCIRSLPEEIESLKGRRVLFKVLVKEQHTAAYIVLKIITDPSVMDKYSNIYSESQESDVLPTVDIRATGDYLVSSFVFLFRNLMFFPRWISEQLATTWYHHLLDNSKKE